LPPLGLGFVEKRARKIMRVMVSSKEWAADARLIISSRDARRAEAEAEAVMGDGETKLWYDLD